MMFKYKAILTGDKFKAISEIRDFSGYDRIYDVANNSSTYNCRMNLSDAKSIIEGRILWEVPFKVDHDFQHLTLEEISNTQNNKSVQSNFVNEDMLCTIRDALNYWKHLSNKEKQFIKLAIQLGN